MFRILKTNLNSNSKDVLILSGARQVGKTTLIKNTFPKAIYINLERDNYLDVFNSRNVNEIKKRLLIDKKGSIRTTLILDEFQKLNDPGLIAKIIHDEIPEVKLIITGSSALEIAFKSSESLSGRKRTKLLYPLTVSESLVQQNKISQVKITSKINFDLKNNTRYKGELLNSMRYGLYPELLNRKHEKEQYLLEYVDSTILKDVFYLNLIRNSTHLINLLRLLAYQIGQLINISDISNRLGITRQTVENYIDILKKIFIIYSLPPFTKKRRDEIGKSEKIYFYDLGIRNALINDFSPVEYRRDFGNIFENFVISEMKKLNDYYNERYNFYFWRTKWGSEVDLILDKDNKQKAIEIKLNRGSVSKGFLNTYPKSEQYVVNLDNIASLIV